MRIEVLLLLHVNVQLGLNWSGHLAHTPHVPSWDVEVTEEAGTHKKKPLKTRDGVHVTCLTKIQKKEENSKALGKHGWVKTDTVLTYSFKISLSRIPGCRAMPHELNAQIVLDTQIRRPI